MKDTPTQIQPPEKPLILYSSIEELPFSIYVVIACSVDLKHLGQGTREELHAAWQNIQDEWDEAIKGSKAVAELQIYLEIEKLKLDIYRQEALFEGVRSYGLTDGLKEQLAEEGYFIESIDELENCVNQSKQLYIHLDNLQERVKDRLPKDGGKVTKKTFLEILVRLSDYKKREIRMDSITTLEFCVHYKDYQDYVEKMVKNPR